MNISAMAAGRFLSGLGAGAALVVVPIFVAEVSPEEGRGRLGAATQIGIGLGVLGAVLMGYFFSEGGGVWRVILAVGVLLGGVYGLGLMGVDESPRWLVGKGRTEDARRALGRLRRGGDVDGEIKGWAGRHDEEDTEEGADDTVEEQEGLLSADAPKAGPNSNNTHHLHHQHVGILEMLSLQRTRPALIAILVAQSAQQLTGINSVIMYSVALLSDLLPSAAALLTVLVALTNLLGTLAFAPLIDSLGRKSCLLLSVATMGSSALALALAMTVGIPVLAGVATLTFVMGFSMGLGPVPFMLAAELVGPGAVGSLQSWGLGANWVATFLVAQLLPPLSLAVGKGGVYFLFTVLGVVYFGLVWVFVPETKGCRDSEAVWARFRDGRKKKGLGTDGGD